MAKYPINNLLNLKISPSTAIVLIGLVVIFTHLTIFPFRYQDDDSPAWLAVAHYFDSGFTDTTNLKPHYLSNPLTPLTALFLSKILPITLEHAYLIINCTALIFTGLLILRLFTRLVKPYIGYLTASLFLIDFHTQYFTFAIMPDITTWMFQIILIYGAFTIFNNNAKSNRPAFIWGLITAIAILQKTNLGFLTIPFIFAFWNSSRSTFIKHLFIYLAAAEIPVLIYYFWVYLQVSALPWATLQQGFQIYEQGQGNRLYAFLPAFFYTSPFILLGLKNFPYPKRHTIFLILIFISLLIPILLWPWVSPRFMYTSFILLLPLAANGLINLTKFFFKNTHHRQLATTFLLILLFSLATLRIHLTLVSHQTHLEFFSQLL